MTRRVLFVCLGVLGVLRGGELLTAQIDPRQMAGIPRPVTDLPNGAVSVRLIRGQLTNNIANHPVDLHIGSRVQTVKTDDMGRAEFRDLPAGSTVKATADVDGEHLESQEFPAPAQGGVRLLLVATESSKGSSAAPAVPAIAGSVVIGSKSRILLEPGEETVQVYYVLDVVNNASAPVNPATPFVFDMPPGAAGTGLLQGSSPLAVVDGARVQVKGPFPPGSTLIQVAAELPAADGSLDIEQRFPAAIEEFSIIVKKLGDIRLSSPLITAQQDVPAQGEIFIAGTGRAVAAGQPLTLSVTGLPHHNRVPRWIALIGAFGIVLVGAWTILRSPETDAGSDAADRKRLVAQREKLFGELVKLEHERRGGRADERRYLARREELLSALEHVYGALDSDQGSPSPA